MMINYFGLTILPANQQLGLICHTYLSNSNHIQASLAKIKYNKNTCSKAAILFPQPLPLTMMTACLKMMSGSSVTAHWTVNLDQMMDYIVMIPYYCWFGSF
jgi:hypothetical protein